MHCLSCLVARTQPQDPFVLLLARSLKMSDQDQLRDLWLSAPEGRLCAREQAKAWALRETWHDKNESTYGLYAFVASKVCKNMNGKPSPKEHPTGDSMREFFAKVDDDDEWFPGKHSDAPRGPKRILCGAKVTAIVSAAKRLKAAGEEPTYSAVVAACPQATLNPQTQEPVDKKLVFTVFREHCYDDESDPSDTWLNLTRLSKSALDEKAKEGRNVFAQVMIALGHTAQ